MEQKKGVDGGGKGGVNWKEYRRFEGKSEWNRETEGSRWRRREGDCSVEGKKMEWYRERSRWKKKRSKMKCRRKEEDRM